MYSPYFLHFSVNNPNFQLGIKLNMKHVLNYCTQRLSHMRNGTFNKSQIKTEFVKLMIIIYYFSQTLLTCSGM